MLFAAVLVFTAHGESAPPVPDYDGVVPENRPLDKHSTAELIQELLRRPLDKLKTADLIGKLHGQPAAPASELTQMDHGNRPPRSRRRYRRFCRRYRRFC